MLTSLWQPSQIKPLIFSIIPNTFKLINLANLTLLFESSKETFWGVVTIIDFALGPIFCAIVSVSSPVPGGKSTIKKSISSHSIPSSNSIIAPIFCGPLQITGSSSGIKKLNEEIDKFSVIFKGSEIFDNLIPSFPNMIGIFGPCKSASKIPTL